MNSGTFGSFEQYKSLEFLTEKISLMDDKSISHISSFIHKLNAKIKKTESINDTQFRNYVLDLIHDDFNKKIDDFILNRYDDKISMYLKNFLHAKIKNAKTINQNPQ